MADSVNDKREERLRRRREAETPEQRRSRLDRQKAYRQKRKASETADQRAARLD